MQTILAFFMRDRIISVHTVGHCVWSLFRSISVGNGLEVVLAVCQPVVETGVTPKREPLNQFSTSKKSTGHIRYRGVVGPSILYPGVRVSVIMTIPASIRISIGHVGRDSVGLAKELIDRSAAVEKVGRVGDISPGECGVDADIDPVRELAVKVDPQVVPVTVGSLHQPLLLIITQRDTVAAHLGTARHAEGVVLRETGSLEDQIQPLGVGVVIGIFACLKERDLILRIAWSQTGITICLIQDRK